MLHRSQHILALVSGVAALGAMASEPFTLTEKDGSLSVTYQGKPLITGSAVCCEGEKLFAPGELISECRKLPDGSTVFNIWSKDPKRRFRQEAVINAAGDRVEINIQTACRAFSEMTEKTFSYTLTLPFERFSGVPFDALIGRSSQVTPQQGSIPASLSGDLVPEKARMFAPRLADGSVIFDFNAQGPANYSGERRNIGQWQVARLARDPENLRLCAASNIPRWGGEITAKLVLTEGGLKEYRSLHPRLSYRYYDSLPAQKLLSFGATQTEKKYTPLDLTPASEKQDGWLDPGDAKIVGNQHPGAFYSAVAGTRPARLAVRDLPPGYYFVTANIGNFEGADNLFSIRVNGELMEEGITVRPGSMTSLTRVFKLSEGTAEVEFSGNWRISTLGFQQLLSLYEDFSFERGFWVTEGFEPGILFRSQDYAQPPRFRTGRTEFVMPDPAKPQPEAKPLEYTTAQPTPEARKAMHWRFDAVIGKLGPGNSDTLEEFNAPGLAERRMDDIKANGFTVVINEGLLSRHTYPRHGERARSIIRKLAETAHSRGIRFIDHIDFTLLWNMDSGFRVAAENPQWLARELDTLLPTTNFCVNNHDRNSRFHQWVREWIASTGIDGMMIDEVNYSGENFCGCADCRNDFERDTGLQFPVSERALKQTRAGDAEAAPDVNDPKKIFGIWRKKRVGDWWVALRRTIEKDHPAFSFLCYTTHYGLTSNYATKRLGSDLLQIGRAADFLGTEIMSRNVWSCARAVFSLRKMQNLFRQAFGTPIFGYVYAPGGWDIAYFGWALNNMNAQVTIAQGQECPSGKSNYYLFGDRNMDLEKARSAADAALLFSSQGRDNGMRMGYRDELLGLAQTLGDMHVNYDVVPDVMLSEKMLEPYKILFLAASAPISDAQLKVIRSFAEKGGHVILGPVAAIADGYARPRRPWPFADLFGFEPSAKSTRIGKLEVSGQTVSLPKPVPAFLPDPCKTETPDAALPLALISRGKRIPAVFEAPLGRGKVKFVPLAAGQFLAQRELGIGKNFDPGPDAVLASVFEHFLAGLLKDAEAGTWQCRAPRDVLTTLYRQDKEYYAHFLNATGVKRHRNGQVPQVIPEGSFPHPEQDIVFILPDADLKTAEAASPDFEGWKALPLQKTEDGVSVTLPKELLTVYTLVRVR